jgi:hypothetical protein
MILLSDNLVYSSSSYFSLITYSWISLLSKEASSPILSILWDCFCSIYEISRLLSTKFWFWFCCWSLMLISWFGLFSIKELVPPRCNGLTYRYLF